MTKRWYVVQSKSKCELEACEHLKNQRYRVFYPQVMELRKVRGKLIMVTGPLFPSYLFVQFDIKQAAWRSVMGTRGVSKLLGANEEYVPPLPKGFIEEFLKRVDKNGFTTYKAADDIVSRYKPGDQLEVSDGIFAGYTGTCRKIQDDFMILILALQAGNFELKLPLTLVRPA